MLCIRMQPVDKVTVELTRCGFSHARIVFCAKQAVVNRLGESYESFSFGQENLPQL